MGELSRKPFRIPDGVDHVISVRPRWMGMQEALRPGYMVIRIWYDGRVEDIGGPMDRRAGLELARSQAQLERTVYLRAPDDVRARPGAVFGEIPGVVLGQRFRRREDVRRAGLHRRPQQGIDWTAEGALAVAFSGRYADDEWSQDDPRYTGEGGQEVPGGRHVRDQELKGGNLALVKSYRAGLPIRVIRKVDAQAGYEYVYEGIYYVVDVHYGPGRDGPKVYRFQLRRAVS